MFAASAAGATLVELESRNGVAIAVLARIVHHFSRDRISVNVVQVMQEILFITNPVVGKSRVARFLFFVQELLPGHASIHP